MSNMDKKVDKKAVTRSSNEIFGLGGMISVDDSLITGLKLPTGCQILRCLMYFIEEGLSENRTKWQAAKIVLKQVSLFYAKGNIPMISDRKVIEKILNLLDKNAKIRQIPASRRHSDSVMKKLATHNHELSQTLQLWPSNAEILVENEEDKKFLQSMRTDRVATFGSFDQVTAAKVKRKNQQEFLAEKRKALAQKEMKETWASSSSAALYSDSDIEEPMPTSEVENGFHKKRKHRRVYEGTQAFIPADILSSPKLVALSTRLNMSPTVQAAFTRAVIDEAGGDSSKVWTSHSQAHKSRRKVESDLAEKYKKEWVPPNLLSLHWDSKLLDSLTNKYDKEERLTIAVGTQNELKLLGVPSYKPGTDQSSGEIIAQLSVDLLEQWECRDNVCNLVYDTTASNTGHVTAACVTIQQRLDRALLWSSCRHHVGELILVHVFEDLKIEASKSPDIQLFKRLRQGWDLVPHDSSEPLKRFDINDFPESQHAFIEQLRTECLETANSNLSMKQIRDDYRELIQLCLVFLDPTYNCKFRRPGAIHKARWMAKLLYCIKICLFENQIANLPQGTITTKQQISKIRRFTHFIILLYCVWWMKCPSSCNSAWNDMQLYKNFLKYCAVDEMIGKSAIKAFDRHLWYLTQELVPLGLFGSNVPAAEKNEMAKKLLEIKPDELPLRPVNRYGSGYGKPFFPENITCVSKLSDFIGEDSWYFFRIMRLDSEFLTRDVQEWEEWDQYSQNLYNVSAINVINDCAERGVKLSSDFLCSAKKEDNYQNILQVVEKNRKDVPNLRKKKIFN